MSYPVPEEEIRLLLSTLKAFENFQFDEISSHNLKMKMQNTAMRREPKQVRTNTVDCIYSNYYVLRVAATEASKQ